MLTCVVKQVLGSAAPDACCKSVTLFEQFENMLVDFIQTVLVR